MSRSTVWTRWLPRLLAILYTLFLSLFAFDSWEGVANFWDGLVAFVVHLMPAYFVLFALVVAWNWPRVGGALFLVLAIGFTLFFGWREAALLAVMAGPLVVMGLLFLVGGWRSLPRARVGG